MSNTVDLDKLSFNIEETSYSSLADSLEYWASQFWLKNIHEDNGDQLAFLLYSMAKEMRKADETSL